MVELIGLGFLFISIIYTGRQIGLYIGMRKKMGRLLGALSPSKSQKRLLMVMAGLFVVLLVSVTYNYISKDIPLGVAYTGLLALVIYSSGRFVSRIVELREDGLLGHLHEISYSEIKHYKIERRKSRGSLIMELKDGREFVSLIALSDIEKIKEMLQNKL